MLMMSATPIPRTLAMTHYADLDVSVLDELPPGRTPITTRWVRTEAPEPADGAEGLPDPDAAPSADRPIEDEDVVWEAVRAAVADGRQAYVVCPLIEESEKLEAASAEETFHRLTVPPDAELRDQRVELLHGRMGAAEKEAVMGRFRAGDTDVLVATTVIEVGVDVPNATVMVVENAERFGLSQLHQLRGRVGRGTQESYCLLVAGDASRKTRKRLEALVKHADGFAIAELDLQLRGPGDLRGTRQSGLPELTVGDLVTDGQVIEQARELAQAILAADPDLGAAWAARLREELTRRSRAVMVREVM